MVFSLYYHKKDGFQSFFGSLLISDNAGKTETCIKSTAQGHIRIVFLGKNAKNDFTKNQ
jgi:hypothetical protein